MTNRFRRVQILTRSLSPVEAVLTVSGEAEQVTPQTELRGRMIGPTCPYAATIEVAYPLRPSPKMPDALPLTGRIVIPEPSLWDPVSPFLYHGHIELWQDGVLHDRASVRHGLCSFRLQAGDLSWNGKPLKLRAASRPNLAPNDLPSLRAAGYNALLLEWPAPALLEAAEHIGFVVLAQLSSPVAVSNSTALMAWVLPKNWRSRESEWRTWLNTQRQLVGAPYDDGPVPEGVRFLIDGPDSLGLPRIVTGATGELGSLE
jgi:hypothetical protein